MLPTKNSPTLPLVQIMLAALSVPLIVIPHQLTATLAHVLPISFQVRSAGTFFPSFLDPHSRGFEFQIFMTGLLLMVGIALSVIARRLSTPRQLLLQTENLVTKHPRVIGAIFAVICGSFYFYLASPPNAYPTNARMHWVDNFFERQTNFFYVLVKLNLLFYETPPVLVAILGAVIFALMFACLQLATQKTLYALFGSITFSFASNVIIFANMAEDVLLNISALLLFAYFYLRRNPLGTGLGLFVVFLGRPSFILLPVAFCAGEFFAATLTASENSCWRRARLALIDQFFMRTLACFVALFFGWHSTLLLLGFHYLSDAITKVGELKRIPVEGFTIFQFSGAYLGHILWTFPIIVLFFCGRVLWRNNRLALPLRAFVFSLAFFVFFNLLLLESLPMHYYNVRYLSYLFPLLWIIAWIPCKRVADDHRPRIGLNLGILLLGMSPFTIHADPIGARNNLSKRPYVQLYEHRMELRRLVGNEIVYSADAVPGYLNYISYLLKRDVRSSVLHLRNAPNDKNVLVFTKQIENFPNHEMIFRGNGVFLIRIPKQQSKPFPLRH